MLQVKEFIESWKDTKMRGISFETIMNDWLHENSSIEVVDIKYNTQVIDDMGNTLSTALVIYKD